MSAHSDPRPTVPLCVDCKFYVAKWSGADEHLNRCGYHISPVNGSPKDFAGFARKATGHCGEAGKHFEPAPLAAPPAQPSSWLARVFRFVSK